ncbi:MAG: hypothetical protein F4Y07_10370 [Gemmatimonadetes bacterium]|nr:hypothetical protein [Gemmatimonadota bacterium]
MSQAQSVAELLKRIEDKALDGDVVQALLLCQQLAGHAGSAPLRAWAEKELNGWTPDEELPDYRMLKGALVGHGSLPGSRVQLPIPPDFLGDEVLEARARSVPVRDSISAVQQTARRESVTLMPNNSALLAQLVNKVNAGSVDFDQIHLQCPGAAYEGIVTGVRSKLMSLVAELRNSLPAEAALDDRRVKAAVSRAADNLVVVAGDHNAVTVGDKSRTIGDNRRWSVRRHGVPAAIGTGLAAVVTFILELLRRGSIWPF